MSARDSSGLQAPLGDLLDDEGLDAESLERVRRRVAATRRVPASRRRPVLALSVAAAVILAAITFVGWPDASSGPLEHASGGRLVSIEGETRLSDGSIITPDGDVALEVVENTTSRMVLVQGDGRVSYQVTPGGTRRWSIDAGAVTVDVTGTRFVVERDDATIRVAVHRGHVRVRGEGVPGGLRSLGRGERLDVSVAPVATSDAAGSAGDEPASTPAPLGPAPPGPPSVPPPDVPATPPEPVGPEAGEPASASAAGATTAGRAPPASPPWLALARASDHAGAFRLLGADGIRRATAESRSVEELLLLADVARAGDHPELAVDPLRAIVEHHSGHRRAAWAALTLGRLQLDGLNQPAEAVSTLERALDLGLPPQLRETALARLVDAHRRAGQPERAVLVRAQYQSEFPNGRYISPATAEPR